MSRRPGCNRTFRRNAIYARPGLLPVKAECMVNPNTKKSCNDGMAGFVMGNRFLEL
jgi:hypothetical protein